MSDKTAAVALALFVLTLGFPANNARAEPAELADAQMDQITAGAWNWSGVAGDLNLIDVNGVHYISVTPTTYRDDTGVTWTLASDIVYYTTDRIAIGVLTSPTQRWDGGVSTGPHPIPSSGS